MTLLLYFLVGGLFVGPADIAAPTCSVIVSQKTLEYAVVHQPSSLSLSIDVDAAPSISGTLPLRASIAGAKIVLTAEAPAGSTLAISETESGRAVKVCLFPTTTALASEPPPTATRSAATSANPVAPPTSSPRSAQPTTGSSGTAKTNSNPTITQAILDLAPPSSPAFSVLGLTPQVVDHPGTPGQLATAFTNGFDQHGNYQTGLALDFAPYMIFAGDGLTITRYAHGTVNLRRWAARTQVSFATTKGVSDSDNSVRMAAGLRTSIFDLGDPRLDTDLSKCFASIGDFGPTLTLTPELEKTLTERIETAAAKCRAASAKRNWNRSSWIIAGAPAWISADGLSGNFRFDGAGVWTFSGLWF